MKGRLRALRPEFPERGAACPRCGEPLDLAGLADGPARCPSCGRAFEATRFEPAAAAAPEPAPATRSALGACGTHPRHAAAGDCQRCGVFVCALCRLSIEGRVLCPACLTRLAEEDALPSLLTSAVDHGAQASTAAAAGLLFWLPLGLLLGPVAVYSGFRALRAATPSAASRPGIVVAMLLGAGEALGSGFVLLSLVLRW